jgi:hypothetical protein
MRRILIDQFNGDFVDDLESPGYVERGVSGDSLESAKQLTVQ